MGPGWDRSALISPLGPLVWLSLRSVSGLLLSLVSWVGCFPLFIFFSNLGPPCGLISSPSVLNVSYCLFRHISMTDGWVLSLPLSICFLCSCPPCLLLLDGDGLWILDSFDRVCASMGFNSLWAPEFSVALDPSLHLMSRFLPLGGSSGTQLDGWWCPGSAWSPS